MNQTIGALLRHLRLLSGSHDGSVRLWDVATSREVRRPEGHTGIITCAAVLPGGRRAVTSGYDRTLRLWNVRK
jgi:WD40 repeat protein